MASEQDLLDRAVARMLRSMVATAGAGAVLLFAWKGWTWSAGFVLGAAVSWFNFRWLKQLVDALGGKRPRTRLAVILGCRYLLLGAGEGENRVTGSREVVVEDLGNPEFRLVHKPTGTEFR